jgi:hypothetical protein
MVIERFRDRDPLPIYRHLRDRGRMVPEGLTYLDSWVEPNFDRCFQLMECDDLRLIQQWVLNWRGSGVTIEIVPVVPSKDTIEVVGPRLDKRVDLLTWLSASSSAHGAPSGGFAWERLRSATEPDFDQTSICFRTGL